MRQDDGALFGDSAEDRDVASSTIYVLRSLSGDSYIAQNRELIHKIGVTGGDVKTRIANAGHDATFLLADVEIIAEYKLANINPVRLESYCIRYSQRHNWILRLPTALAIRCRPKNGFLYRCQ